MPSPVSLVSDQQAGKEPASREGKPETMRLRTAIAPALLVAAAALFAAGCGGGTGGSNSSGSGGALAANQTLTMAWGAEPPSLDPGLATDTTSSNVLLNIMDPLIKLDPKTLEPVPSLAQNWDVNGATVTFHLRHDGRWTNGDPVTANDFVYSWLRTLSPELGADYAYQFYGITGAQAYNSCDPKKADCNALKNKVGISAPDKYTLRVKLTSPQPWFVQQVAHTSFLAVNRKAVERWGEKWTEPGHIVTNGPFKLAVWNHDAEIDLVKWNGWRDAKDVTLMRVNGRIITDGTTAVQSFAAGEIDVNTTGIPPADLPRLKTEDTYQNYPALGTYFYGLNVKNIPLQERKAMALAIDRKSIIDNIAQADQVPATSFSAKGIPGFGEIKNDYLQPTADMGKAKALLAKTPNAKKHINLFVNDAPGHKEIAIAVQAAWKKLGIDVTIKQMEFAQFLEFLGPPPNKAVDAYRLGWIGDYVDDINFLETWTCHSGNNNSNYCNPRYDALVEKARSTKDNAERFKIYAQAEDILTGPNGDFPVIPIYWYTYVTQEAPSVKDSFNINLLNQFDLSTVKVVDK
jgi:oligopeptide transport system substrate-binding protein